MKKRGKLFLWIGVGFMLLSIGIGLNLYVPGPPIELSKQTTVITAPLGSRGLPQFGRYWDETQSKGVTPEINAAAIIWQAVGSCDLPTSDFVKICQSIGIEPVASSTERIVHITDKQLLSTLNKWLVGSTSANALNNFESRTGAEQLLEQLMSRPWSGQQVPPMLKWTEEIQPRLDMLLEASMRPRYYSPSPSYLNDCDTPLPSMNFPDLHDDIVRSCVRDLDTRAMWHLGEGRPMSAWTDVYAGYRFSRLVAQGATKVHRFAAYAIEMMSCRATNTILDSRQLSPEEIQTIISDLDDLPQSASIVETIDTWERLEFIDSILAYSTGHWTHPYLLEAPVPHSYLLASVNWNEPLRIGNQWFDRLVTAAKISDQSARTLAFDTIYSDLMYCTPTDKSVLSKCISRKGRTELVTFAAVNLLLPAAGAMVDCQYTTTTIAQLTRTAAVLALYRAEHGMYPESLGHLVPSILPTIPIDSYSEQPLIYERRNDGYLLYSVGKNGVDDNGVDVTGRIYDGEWLHLGELPPGGRDVDNFDLVVRMPQPQFVLPVPATISQ